MANDLPLRLVRTIKAASAIGVCQVALAQAGSTDPQAFVAAWKHTIVRARALPSYRLTGTSQMTILARGSGQPHVRRLEWSALWDGSRYRVEWEEPGDKTNHQSFDGTAWYGLTERPGRADAIVSVDPERSVEGNLDTSLQTKAAGLFYLSIADYLARPINVSGLELPAAYEDAPRGLVQRVDEDGVTLMMPPGNNLALPESLKFKFVDDLLIPVQATLPASGENGVVQRLEVKEVGLLDGVPYPKTITYSIAQTKGPDRGEVIRVEFLLKAEAMPTVASDFRLTFPSGAYVLDDRKDGAERYVAPASSTSAEWGQLWVVAGGIAVVVMGLWLIRRHAPKHGA